MSRLLLPPDQFREELVRPPRVLLLFFGVALPALCFAISHGGLHVVASGWPGRMARAMMEGPCTGPFYPLILFSMASMALALFWPRSTSLFCVRLGIGTGALIALQYVLIEETFLALGVQWGWPYAVLFGAAGLGIVLGLRWLIHSLRRREACALWSQVYLAAVPGLLVIALCLALSGDVGLLVILSVFSSLAWAPFWALLGYVWMALRLRRQPCVSSWAERVWSLIFWSVAYGAALRAALDQAVQAVPR